MKEIIVEKLSEIEKENDITIIYALESGSRAWGHYKTNPNLREWIFSLIKYGSR